MASYTDILLGRLFLQSDLASVDQVNACLVRTRIQGKSLAEILVQQGYAQADMIQQMAKVIAHKQFLRAELIFAQILLRQGLVSRVALVPNSRG